VQQLKLIGLVLLVLYRLQHTTLSLHLSEQGGVVCQSKLEAHDTLYCTVNDTHTHTHTHTHTRTHTHTHAHTICISVSNLVWCASVPV
jgi:hypothetical protein